MSRPEILRLVRSCGPTTQAPSAVQIVAESRQMRQVLAQVDQIKDSDATVLITGETGTGKELIARLLHYCSRRRDRRFSAFFCGNVSCEIIDSHLFGYRRGAFTGANGDFLGLVRATDGGTLFLDEIGEVETAVQAKLLRLLQERTVMPLGDCNEYSVNVRIVAATNQDLENRVAEGRFRQDLYFRLNVFRIHLPPLRERRSDILPLMEHFLDKHGRKYGKRIAGFSPDAVSMLEAYDWPGNVRELEAEIERLVVACSEGGIINELSLSPWIRDRVADMQGGRAPEPPSPERSCSIIYNLAAARSRLERELIERALKAFGSKHKAAKALGISRPTLNRLIRRHKIIA